MIIKKVILENFFRYYSIQEIDCSVQKDKNVVVLIGENGRGKTTLLNAFNWVFYDEIIKPLTTENLLNSKKRRELKVGEETEASVTIFFEEEDIEYKIKRKLLYKMALNGDVNLISNKSIVSIYKIECNGNQTELNYGISAEKLLIPKDLRGFFFFDGERINRLAKVDGKKEIKNAILNILGISYLNNTKDHLMFIRKSLIDKMKRYKSNNGSSVDLIWKHNKFEKEILEIKNEMQELEDKLEQSNKNMNELNNIISESSIKSVRNLEENNKKLSKQISENSYKLVELEKNIKKHIANNFKYYLLFEYVEEVEKLLELKRKEGQLPSNVKDTFIDDLIDRGICICGACLKKGTKEYEAVLSLRDRAGTKELDDAYYNLKNLIKNIKEQHVGFYKKLNLLIDERNKTKNKIFNDSEELKIVSEKLKHCDSDEIKNASKAREICEEEITNITKNIGVLEEKLNERDKNIKEIEKSIQLVKSTDQEICKLRNKIKVTDKLIDVNSEFRELFIEVVRVELDKRIKEVYSKITNKEYRVPVLTDKFELKVLSKLNEYSNEYEADEEVLSTGEGQITSLSFIGALVSYARDTKEDMILSKLSHEEYPIVMDSPFGNLDESHTRNIASNIGKLAPQVIIVVSQKQWEGHVKDNIEKQVIRKYFMIDGKHIYDSGEYTEIVKGEGNYV